MGHYQAFIVFICSEALHPEFVNTKGGEQTDPRVKHRLQQ